MNLITQPERWMCGIASMAMLLNESIDNLILELGHDGSERSWPTEPEPLCYRGFTTQEYIDLCFARGFGLIVVDSQPVIVNREGNVKRIFARDSEENRVLRYMTNRPGVIIGEVSSGKLHACAWDGEKVYDPMGSVYHFDDSNTVYPPIAVAQFMFLVPLPESNP